ncbi:sterol desaturase family protein [Pseudogemmatithrix spongiicola]|uniref:Sterol desaturase family protein n=1 Tax=Pseudogemmatithrix spongiicola TaxID=3062599 RepID=A0AA49JWP1_9BACT|nr:sterol desaturase family protein [Gemmatimonadaceae bacterium 'strain 138']WKW15885.1 sterol desaturase family protein [Gemmatimonadaceae bacterium 'strain 318']
MGIIKASIPLFFLLIAAELLWSKATGRRVMRMNDSLSDLSCGILSQLAGIFTKLFTIGIFIWVADRWAVQHWLPAMPAWPERAPFLAVAGFPWLGVDVAALLSWSAVFVLVDFCYYWSHRYAHEINILWAGHVVHHSSEEYNLPVALRQSALHGLMSWVFYMPLAFMGVPWRMFVACNALNLIYQFWIHTRAVGRLSPLGEYVLNTPSHHRVHHGVNPKYQDKNYAGVFIVFDRWFGTFQVEEEEPVYGITKPLKSWNPLWANVHVFVQIAKDAWRAERWRDKLRIVFGRPGWRPPELGAIERPQEVSADTFVKYDPPVPAPLAWYAFTQFTIALLAAFVLLGKAEALPLWVSGIAAFFIAVALAGVGGIFESARWAGTLETARQITVALGSGYLLWTGLGLGALAWAGLGVALLSLAVLARYRGHLTATELAPLM